MAQGLPAEALCYAQAAQESNGPPGAVAKACETILLESGMIDEAYARYAIIANEGSTHLATFRAIVKKYPHKQPCDVLLDLVASDPGSDGKWFAAAKDAGLFELARHLRGKVPPIRERSRAQRETSAIAKLTSRCHAGRARSTGWRRATVTIFRIPIYSTRTLQSCMPAKRSV